MKIAYIDHYDSFSFNLIDWLVFDTGLEIDYLTWDDRHLISTFLKHPMPIVLSPGPHRPEVMQNTLDLLSTALGKVPIFGVCLGHQCLGYALGGEIVSAKRPFHGSVDRIFVDNKHQIGKDFSNSFHVACYNSLVIKSDSLPQGQVWARNSYGEIQGLFWHPEDGYSALGIQYHPESFLSEDQGPLKMKWIALVKEYYQGKDND